MWKLWVSFGLLVTTLVVLGGVSRSDGGDPDGLPQDPSFPLPPPENTPLAPVPPGTPMPRQPFTLYEHGPPGSEWRYDQLSADEQEVVDLGRDVSGWAAGQNAMVEAVRAEAFIQAGILAQRQLGLGELGDTGVVP